MKSFQSNLQMAYRSPFEIKTILTMTPKNFIKTNKGEWLNLPLAFDIETTSQYYNNSKAAFMYEWTLGINGFCIVGREWHEFLDCMSEISAYFETNKTRIVVIYVHNLGYEFQFFRKLIGWVSIFAIKERTPLKALSNMGIEFRCSYLLSGMSLARLGDSLTYYKIQKLVGDLDYSLCRHSKTPLTETEIHYCLNDVKIIMCYIQEQIELNGNITRIPLTKTGYVRKYCRDSCLYDGSHKKNTKKWARYNILMKSLTLEIDEYNQLKRAFQGGFTHACLWHSGQVIKNVDSYDFTSSYPYVMLSEKFPMSKGEKIEIKSIESFYKNLKLYCCMFDIEFTGLVAKTIIEHPLSSSKCRNLKNYLVDNGRIISADIAKTTITEQDYFTLSEFYSWKTIKISNFVRYRKQYLPTDFVKSILKLYADKTELKGVDEKYAEYALSKEMINSAYGMCVTDICKDDLIYSDGEWSTDKADTEKLLKKYNNSKNRFISYPWGVWVTAYARRNLFNGILNFGNDYIYSDTDSIKCINADKHQEYIKKYNALCDYKLKKAMEYHDIPFEMTRPKTIEGIEKPLGVWDFDGHYTRFKTLGAKRYLVEYEKKGKISHSLTVAGLNKFKAIPYLESLDSDIFDLFNDDMIIPKEFSGRNTHTYIDTEIDGIITDYLGNTAEFHSKSGVFIEGSDYTMSLALNYKELINSIGVVEII